MAVAQLPAQHPHKASCRLTQPREPPWTLENLQEKAAVWNGVLEGSREVTGALPSMGEERQTGSRAWEARAVPGMLLAVLQEAAPCREFVQLDGAGYVCSSFQQQQQMPPWLQGLRIAVFPGEECCQEEYLGYSS